jgi:L-asparaginase/Glu-tRNA(Gln) amidotransferase subunit D
MAVLMQVAEVKKKSRLAGLVAVGDRVGVLQNGTRRGLEFAVKQGVPVVRLAADSHTAPVCDSDYFIDGGKMTPSEASVLLAKCLERYGPLPEAMSASSAKLESLRNKMRLYQAEFAAHQSPVVASR